MKSISKKFIYSFGIVLALCACKQQKTDPMPSWNPTDVKAQIVEYVETAAEKIPVEDRIAVFDMDGTIACESPLWFEAAVAVQGMMDQLREDSSLISKTEYQMAKRLSENPADTTVLNHWVVGGVNYLDSILLKPFAGKDHEYYVEYAKNYLAGAKAPKYDRVYGDLFYQPMLELIQYLKDNKFQIYLVSGSMQGVVWSIASQTVGLDREQLLGTRQLVTPVYKDGQTDFIIQKAILQPKNDGNGKSQNIYSHIGKTPVLAVGNTVGDFGMFHLASTSKYPHLAVMINHDDSEREYAYEPYHGTPVEGWRDSLQNNGWVRADMSKEFKTVWKK